MEITRSGILMDCLEEVNKELHKYSKHGNGLLPLEGYEKHFDDLNEKCRLLRAMIIENQEREKETGQEEVHTSKPLAQWQMEIIKGMQPEVDWADKAGMTPDEAILRRRHQKAEGFKPEPVVYPGGEE